LRDILVMHVAIVRGDWQVGPSDEINVNDWLAGFD
jgi:hypothetical protein